MNKPHLLLVEDECRLAQFLSLELQDAGYDITVAYDGPSGLAMAMNRPFDLLLLDWNLPRGSGLDICQRLQLHCNPSPVVMLTAYNDLGRIEAARQAGVSAYLIKPFDVDKLTALLGHFLPEGGVTVAA